jgi:hypothetical protein
LEIWDHKPAAPLEVRGPIQPIETNVSGIQISELLLETAKQADKLAIMRSMTSPLGEHGLAHPYLLTGYKLVCRRDLLGKLRRRYLPFATWMPAHWFRSASTRPCVSGTAATECIWQR